MSFLLCFFLGVNRDCMCDGIMVCVDDVVMYTREGGRPLVGEKRGEERNRME